MNRDVYIALSWAGGNIQQDEGLYHLEGYGYFKLTKMTYKLEKSDDPIGLPSFMIEEDLKTVDFREWNDEDFPPKYWSSHYDSAMTPKYCPTDKEFFKLNYDLNSDKRTFFYFELIRCEQIGWVTDLNSQYIGEEWVGLLK